MIRLYRHDPRRPADGKYFNLKLLAPFFFFRLAIQLNLLIGLIDWCFAALAGKY